MLTDKKVLLRPPQPEDKAFLYRLRNDVTVQTSLMALARANSPRRVDDWIEGVLNDSQSLFFIIAAAETNQGVGFIQLRRMDFVHGTGDLGICLDEPARGKNFAGPAITLLEGHARDVFGLRKVVLYVLAANRRAISCYQKCGYTSVGVLKEHFYHAGSYQDVLIMEHLLAKKS